LSQNKYDITDFTFICTDKIRVGYRKYRKFKPSESGIYYNRRSVIVHPKHVKNLGFWVHEFTESAIINVLRRWKKPFLKTVKFEGYKPTTIAHFISPYGANNKRNLFPQKSRREPKW